MAFASTGGRVPDGQRWKALPEPERLTAPTKPTARAQRLPRGPLVVIATTTILLVAAVAAVLALRI